MKRKLKGVLGVGLTLVLLVSLTAGLAVPAAADPGTLKWSKLTLPKVEAWTTHATFVDAEGDYWAAPGTDVGAIATSPDGDTLFAAVGADSYLSSSWYDVLKSTDGGYSWVATGFWDEWDDVTDTTPIVDIVVSPDYDEDLTVFVATEDFLYQSVDGGKHFVAMTTGWDADEAITDLDVALDDRGRLAIMVGTSTVVPVTLGVKGAGTAAWSTTQKHSGQYSVDLKTGITTQGDEGRIVIVPPGVTTLGDLDTLSWWVYPVAGYPPHVDIYLDCNGNGVVDPEDVLTAEINYNTPCAGWTFENPSLGEQYAAGYGNWWQTFDFTCINPSGGTTDTVINDSTILWACSYGGGPGDAPSSTLAHWKAGTVDGDPGNEMDPCPISSTTPVVRFEIEVDSWISWTDDTVDLETNSEAYIDDITINGVTYDLELTGAYGSAGDVYVLATATGMSWQAQLIGAYDVLAVAFSPLFADDEGIGAVVTSASKTRVRWSFSFIGATDPSIGWGADIGDGKIKTALMAEFASAHARMAFPDDFDAWGIGNNICFVGVYSAAGYAAHANALGDVYKVVLKSGSTTATDLDIRGVLTTLLPTATDITTIDVCGDAEDASILVGTDYSDLTITPEQFLTYYSDDGGETWRPSATKSPTGGDVVARDSDTVLLITDDAMTYVLMSPDYCDSGIGYAATWGVYTSAFSHTKDSGATWDQISLVDYGDGTTGYNIDDLDAAGYNADGTLHMTTHTGSDGAIWKRTGGKNWERIWSYANMSVTDGIEELIINGDETMFAIDYVTKSIGGGKYIGYIWRSSDMGATWPKKITTKPDLSAVAVVSPTTLYTGHADGNIYWSTKSGTGWTKPDDSEIPSTAEVANIGVKGDFVLVGANAGTAYISSDGGETVERVGLTDPGISGPPTYATYDLGFADNNIIYAITGGEAGVWRCEVDLDDPGSSEWEQIDGFQDITPYNAGTVGAAGPPLTLPPSGVLYVINEEVVIDEDEDKEGGLWRCTNPTDPDPYPYFEKENKNLDAGDKLGFLDVDLFPFVQFCAVSNGTTAVHYYNQVVMFTDTLDTGVPQTDPTKDATGVGLLPAGETYPKVGLVWEEMDGATSYQYQIAYDPGFKSIVKKGFTTSLVSPGYDLSPNKSYYWRVRVAAEDAALDLIGAPLISPWSEAWKFKTAIGATMARPGLEAPEAGEVDVLLSPTFEWSGIEWAETYEFELATSPSTTAGGYFADVLVGLIGTNALVSTAWKCDIALDYESRYYWHVKAIGVDTETPWSDVGTFTTMGVAPTPPEPAPPMVIPPVEEITPIWLWVIIGIGAALMIAVIILIVTTRRVP